MPSRPHVPITVFAALCLVLLGGRPAEPAQGYQYFVVGNPADVVTPTSGLLVLQGGGTDVDENFVRMGAHAGGGSWRLQPLSTADVLKRMAPVETALPGLWPTVVRVVEAFAAAGVLASK